jgi:signal transduction histidine kinase
MNKIVKLFIESVNKLSVAKKTSLLILTMLTGMLFIGSFAHLSLNRIKNEFDILYLKHTVPIIKLEALKDVYTVNILDTLRDIEIYKISVKDGKTIIRLAQELIHRHWNEYEKSVDIDESDWIVKMFRDWGVIPKDNGPKEPTLKDDLMAQTRDRIDKIDIILNQMFYYLDNQQQEKAFLLLQDELYPSIHSVNIHLTQLINFSLEAANDGKKRTDRVYISTFGWIVIGVVGTIFCAGLFAMIILQNIRMLYTNMENMVKEKTKELVKLNQGLERRIAQEIKQSRQKDEIMYRQSRLAAMGEMIGNIAHQWRQPLNALTVLIQSFQIKQMQGKLDKDFVDSQVNEGLMLANTMSKTIDDFRNFFRPEKEKQPFSVWENIKHSVDMLKNFYAKDGVKIILVGSVDYEALGFANEFSQVIMNLLSNAKDALMRQDKERLIEVSIDGSDKGCIISVIDNGGGMDQTVLDRMFDPYFTTKHQASGTGIGLYMSKQIIEKQMHGTISAFNASYKFSNGAVYEKCAVIQICILAKPLQRKL